MIKNVILIALGLSAVSWTLYAVDEQTGKPPAVPHGCGSCGSASEASAEEDWSAFQIVLSPEFPAGSDYLNISGLKLGIIASGGKGTISGVEAASISSSTDNVYGLQASAFANVAKFLAGMQAGLVNVITVGGDLPFQLGIVNYARETGVQFGIVNLLPDSSIPFFPLININTVSKEKAK